MQREGRRLLPAPTAPLAERFINDFLMAIFFLLAGREIEFEIAAGELKNPRKALLPILGAVEGAIASAPALHAPRPSLRIPVCFFILRAVSDEEDEEPAR